MAYKRKWSKITSSPSGFLRKEEFTPFSSQTFMKTILFFFFNSNVKWVIFRLKVFISFLSITHSTIQRHNPFRNVIDKYLLSPFCEFNSKHNSKYHMNSSLFGYRTFGAHIIIRMQHVITVFE